jgi:hypothetical protein
VLILLIRTGAHPCSRRFQHLRDSPVIFTSWDVMSLGCVCNVQQHCKLRQAATCIGHCDLIASSKHIRLAGHQFFIRLKFCKVVIYDDIGLKCLLFSFMLH